jgi:hypothetical protein
MGSSVVGRAKPGAPGLTVADLKRRGPATLDDAQVKRVLVGKTPVVRKTVTGQRFAIFFACPAGAWSPARMARRRGGERSATRCTAAR